jgi:glycosyltransferase involved in cell wall biosynthesis
LEYVKGFDLLITAFANAQINDTDLLIVGDGDERNKLISLASDLGLSDRIIFTGAKTDLQDYYSQAELFVLPSRNEGYPNALVEAMSFGCPSIAMDCEFGPSEIIINEQNGLLVQAANVADLACAISRLMNNSTFRKDLGRKAVHINDTNSPQQIFKKWEGLLLRHV